MVEILLGVALILLGWKIISGVINGNKNDQ